MAIFSSEEKTRQIALWSEALARVSQGQEYTIGSRRLRRADLSEIRKTLEWLDAQPAREDAQSGLGLPRLVPLLPGRGGRC